VLARGALSVTAASACGLRGFATSPHPLSRFGTKMVRMIRSLGVVPQQTGPSSSVGGAGSQVVSEAAGSEVPGGELPGCGSPGRALTALAPCERVRHGQVSRPSALFLAQLIAHALKAPQTRQRRKAEPGQALAAYATAAEACLMPASRVRRRL
jgi:hypothetical protein